MTFENNTAMILDEIDERLKINLINFNSFLTRDVRFVKKHVIHLATVGI